MAGRFLGQEPGHALAVEPGQDAGTETGQDLEAGGKGLVGKGRTGWRGMLAEGHRLAELIDNVLDLAALESGHAPLVMPRWISPRL